MSSATTAGDVQRASLLRTPLLAELIRHRWLVVCLAALGGIHVSLTAAGLSLWRCPAQSLLGISCPGCGMTRAVVALLSGHWGRAMQLHPLAPGFLAGSLLVGFCQPLPAGPRARVERFVRRMEERTCVTAVFLLAFAAFGICRMLARL